MQISEQLLRTFEPKEEWLSRPSYLHGVGHLTRVFILQELISMQLKERGVEINREALRFASMAHDVGRIDDGKDLAHGKRSARWLAQNFAHKLSPEDMDTASYIVHWHVPPDSEAPEMINELKVLKDADGLDRVRLGDLDPTRLRTDVAQSLIDTAQKLYDASQPNRPYEKDSFETVLAAARQLRIVK